MKLHSIILTLLVVNLSFTESQLSQNSKVSFEQFGKKYISRLRSRRAKDLSYRLPDSIKPKNYKIVLTPHFDDEFGKNFTFDGIVEIMLEIVKEMPEIILHSKFLEFSDSDVILRRQSNDQPIDTIVEEDTQKHFIYIKPMNLANLTDGVYILKIVYKGILNTDVKGFYRTSYKNENDETIWLATSQFEPIGARQAFPCFDEPQLKATFDLTIRHSLNHNAISNMPIKTSAPIGTLQETVFLTTPLMPTYLLAFVISDFKNLHTNENFTVYARPSLVNDGRLALEAGQSILEFLELYTGVEFIIPKIDQVAVPGKSGAMENWGLILYQENVLLHNSQSGDGGKITVEIIAHEFAHQWFGNLVTPKWWKFLWLSEGFATFFQSFITDQIKPEWRSTDFSVVENIRGGAFIADSDVSGSHPLNRNVERPEEIQATFDNISYRKGSAIVRMMYHFLGTDLFKRGINKYLTKNKYKAVESNDLFQAFDEALEESKFNLENNLGTIMNSWVNCKGYPAVTITRDSVNPRFLTIDQQRFYSNGNTKEVEENEEDCVWYVPINYATAKQPEFENTSLKFWLQETSKNVTIEIESDEWLVINKQQTGFYRVNYDNKSWQLIINHLNSEKLHEIHVLNRAQLLDDALAFAKKDSLNLETLLRLTLYLNKETDYIALHPGNEIISWLEVHLRNTHHYSSFKSYVLNIARNILNSTSLEKSAEDKYIDKKKRNIAIHWACFFKDRTCTDYMQNKLEEELNKPQRASSEFYKVSLCEGLRTASFALWEKVFEKYLSASSYEEELVFMSVLGCSSETRILQYYLNYTNSDSFSSYRDILYIVSFILENSEFGVDNVLDHFTKIFKDSLPLKYVYEIFLISLFELVGKKITTKAQLDRLKAFEETYIPANIIVKGIEAAEKNMRWLEQNEDALIAWREEIEVNIK